MIYLREANSSDLPLILSWRNNPLVYESTYSQKEPISWEEHIEWYSTREDHKFFMVLLVDYYEIRPIGYLNISPLTYWSPEIGIVIGEVSLWGKGKGLNAFYIGCQWLKDKGYKWTSTTVKDDNKRMIRILDKLGFKRTCDAREGESRYALELKNL